MNYKSMNCLDESNTTVQISIILDWNKKLFFKQKFLNTYLERKGKLSRIQPHFEKKNICQRIKYYGLNILIKNTTVSNTESSLLYF